MSLPPIQSLGDYSSAIIVKPSSLGDIVHTLPAVHLLKEHFPKMELRWLCNPEWMPLLECNRDLVEVLPFPRQRFKGVKGFGRAIPWAFQLNIAARHLPEVALDFQGLLRSALICKVRGASPIIGLSDAREGASYFYRQTIPINADDHAVDRYLGMVRAAGIEYKKEDLVFNLPPGTPLRGVSLPERFWMVHPEARGAEKSLSPQALQAICDCLAPSPVVIVGRSSSFRPPAGAHVISLVNQTDLHELIWVSRQAMGCISVDSGPMHIASALNPRTLGIHSWSDPRKVGPYQDSAWVWKAGRIAKRQEFSDAEAAENIPLDEVAARRLVDFVLEQWK